MATLQAAAISNIVFLTPTQCTSTVQFTGFNIQNYFTKGLTQAANYSDCQSAVLELDPLSNGFFFDPSTTPPTCQLKQFDARPGANLFIFTPSGMVNLGSRGGDAFKQPELSLGKTIKTTGSVCSSICAVNPACAISAFASDTTTSSTGWCYPSTLQKTNTSSSLTLFTGRRPCPSTPNLPQELDQVPVEVNKPVAEQSPKPEKARKVSAIAGAADADTDSNSTTTSYAQTPSNSTTNIPISVIIAASTVGGFTVIVGILWALHIRRCRRKLIAPIDAKPVFDTKLGYVPPVIPIAKDDACNAWYLNKRRDPLRQG
ncbi:hypothetical protein BJ741DRAFT_579952 [Chytriomyces cf. hyalinus JEL632]|nr:hypothetical protein BJ741DRAFT_579952 [Chytriomyces cf. hyalinus JEL632]